MKAIKRPIVSRSRVGKSRRAATNDRVEGKMIRSPVETSDRGAVEKGASIFISCARLIRVVSRIQGVSSARFVPLPSLPFTHSRYFSFLVRGHTYACIYTYMSVRIPVDMHARTHRA